VVVLLLVVLRCEVLLLLVLVFVFMLLLLHPQVWIDEQISAEIDSGISARAEFLFVCVSADISFRNCQTPTSASGTNGLAMNSSLKQLSHNEYKL
jgi:hypothetical protein